MRLGEGKEEEAIKALSVLRIFFFPNRKTPIRGDFHFKFPVVGILFHTIHIGKKWEQRLCNAFSLQKTLTIQSSTYNTITSIGQKGSKG